MVSLSAGHNLLQGSSQDLGDSSADKSTEMRAIERREARLAAELAELHRRRALEEQRMKEREEAERKRKEEEERRRREQQRRQEERERREGERQRRSQEEASQSPAQQGSSSPRRSGTSREAPTGSAVETRVSVSVQSLRPSAAIVSLAARRCVLESAWVPLRGDIRPRVGDEVVSGRGPGVSDRDIRPMHMEFFLPR